MSAKLLPVWNEIVKYIDAGISVIPVRDREGQGGVVKTPFGRSWKQYQKEIIRKDTLFHQMDVEYDTTAVAIVCGKVSGNLEIIDIDVKYKPGIDAQLFSAIRDLYPEILEKLRIHSTPSGGYHIIYRCTEEVPGSQKLASRPKTEGELAEKPSPKVVTFIETRGEGGYAVAPPALDYEVKAPVPVPILSVSERNSLIALAESFNEHIVVEKPPRPKKAESDYYDTNPFDDFNNRVDPTALVESLGWKYHRHNSQFIWYTRPGKKTGVSMSFNLFKRFFFNFTGSTILEENKGYSPANLLAHFAFGGDKKKLYADLVSKGYGAIKPKMEAKLVRIAATNNKPLPPNVSQQAVIERENLVVALNEQYPFGTFWIDSIEKGIQIDRQILYNVAAARGFYLYQDDIVYSDGIFIEKVTERFFFDHLKAYITEEDADLYNDLCNAYEAYIEKHGKFTITRLPMLDEETLLSDTATDCYKVYQNGVLHITKDGYNLRPVEGIGKLIWKKNVQPRNFVKDESGPGGRYVDFLKLATEFETDREYILSVIGFLAHEFKDDTTAYIVVLTEQCEDPKEGGGAGKNVFSNLFNNITSVANIPGEQVKYDTTFMQSWNGERILCISDVPRSFNYVFLKELSSGSGVVKKLWKNEVIVPVHLMPKPLVQTNYSIEIKDGGLKRRTKIIEFTDFFTKAGGIDVHFGIHFPLGWNEKDWSGFDTLMADAVTHWLRSGRKIGQATLSQSGWMKQFEHSYGQVITGFISEYFDSWKKLGEVKNDDFYNALNTYCVANNVAPKYKPSIFRINTALTDYCKYVGVHYAYNLQRSANNIKYKYRQFGNDDLPF